MPAHDPRVSLALPGRTLLAAALLAGIVAVGAPAPAARADDDPTIDQTMAMTYELVPAKGVIRVTVEVRVTNRKPDAVAEVPCVQYVDGYPVSGTCRRTTRYYLDATPVAVERSARGLGATADQGTARLATIRDEGGFRVVRVSFAPVYYGQTRVVRVTYEIPGAKPRSDDPTRAGKAFASFCIVAQGADGGSTRAILPAAYEVTQAGGDDLRESTTGGRTVLESGNLANPYDFWACLEGVNAAGYARSVVAGAGGRTVDLRSWPEDAEWTKAVSAAIRDAIPALESLTGYQLPGGGRLNIREVSRSELGNYAGIIDTKTLDIRLAEDYDRGTVAHELSHAWFNGQLFDETWLQEGYAGWVEAASGLAPARLCLQPTAPAGAAPVLRTWEYLGPRSTDADRARVDYLYDASCWIVRDVADAIGTARLREVLAAAKSGAPAYPGADAATAGSIDWRRWLDLVDELGFVAAGREPGLAADLLLEYGVTTDRITLQDRAAALAAYRTLQEDAGAWQVPPAVTRPLGTWHFGDATEAERAATAVLGAWATAEMSAGGLALDETAVRKRFEKATEVADLTAAAGLATRTGEVAANVVAARAAATAERDTTVQVGLLGEEDPAAAAGRAADALARGDLDAASAEAGVALSALAAAAERGSSRIAIGVAATVVALLLLLLVTILLVRRRRRIRRSRSASRDRGSA